MRYIGWFVHLLTRCLLGGSACWVVHHCTVCGCLMVLKLFSIQDKMGRILWRTWPLWRCWWYWLWWWVSTPTRGGTTISTLRRVSIAGTPMLLDKLTLLPNKDNQPGDRGHSPWGHGPLVGGTMMVSQLFLFILFLLSYSTLFHPTPLHSTPLPTPNLLISPDFVNHYCALCPLALPCLDTWPHSISNIWHILILLKCVPQPHTLGYCTACSFICTCMHIAMILQFFSFVFPYFSILLHSAASATLCSTPTHNPLIFPYFIDHHHTSCFSALLCWQTWPHSIHETYLTYDAYWHHWNAFPLACIPR